MWGIGDNNHDKKACDGRSSRLLFCHVHEARLLASLVASIILRRVPGIYILEVRPRLRPWR